MHTVRRLAPTAALVASLLSSLGAAAADRYQVDPVHTFVLFRVQHLGLSYSYGRFTQVDGTFSVDEGDLAKSAVELTIRADSIATQDAKRDAHLNSPDFFNSKAFPVIRFVGKRFARGADGHLQVTGDLTLHGVIREITLPMDHVGEGKDPWGGYRSGYEGRVSLKRTDYGMDFMVGPVGETVELILAVEGIRQ